MLLGELLGNPKGTKSFSSWSEFTDFVNEMPIKTIQPFVSNFNAFAGEGFYGNVVQGLVIKQLEDAVFIFGIAIDGTLIFRKRSITIHLVLEICATYHREFRSKTAYKR